MTRPYVLFLLDGTSYGVEADAILSLEMVEGVTPVPDAPPFVEGVVHLRGRIVPVVNLRRRFGLEPAPHGPASRLVVVRLEERVVALAVDSAREFVSLDEGTMSEPPSELGRARSFLRGVLMLDRRMILILDPRRAAEPPDQGGSPS